MKRFKTNVLYTNINYSVRPTQKQVACNLEFSIDLNKIPGIDLLMRNNLFNKYIRKNFKVINYNDGFYPDIYKTIVAFSDCKDSDKFDVSFGKKMALTRAQKDAFIASRDFYNYAGYLVGKACDELANFSYNCDKNFTRCKSHVTDLVERKYNS